MPDARVLDMLNGLLAATRNSPLGHLSDSAAFLSFSDTALAEDVQAMIVEEQEHAAALAELLIELGGMPQPAPPNAHTADLHYLELHFLLPRLLQSKEALLVAYESARARLAGAGPGRALELVSRLAARQRQHAEKLRALLPQSRSAVAGSA